MSGVAILPAASPVTLQSHETHRKFHQNSAVGYLRNCNSIKEFMQVHVLLIKTGLAQDEIAAGKLIASCSQLASAGSIDYARAVFHELQETNIFMWNSMIRGYANMSNGAEALSLYHMMLLQGISPDHFTFPFLLNACTKIMACREGMQVQASLIKLGYDSDVFIQNSLVHFYSVCGDMDLAQKMFDRMPERNVVAWTVLVCGFVRNGFPEQAVAMFERMLSADVRANEVTMANVVSACAQMKNLELGMKVHRYIEDARININVVLSNAIVDMYAKCGDMVVARKLFDEMPEKNIVLWNIMLSNYSQRGEIDNAIVLFRDLLKSDARSDRVSVVAMLNVCSQVGDLKIGKTLPGYVFRNGLESEDFVGNAAIDMYMKCGAVKEAMGVFNNIQELSVASWNTMIAGCVKNGDLESGLALFKEMPQRDLVSWNTMIATLTHASFFEDALALFREMQLAGVTADRITMVSVASACGYLGALDLATWIHAFIGKNNIDLDVRLGTAMIDMYSRCGDAKRAIEIFNRMHQNDVFSWTSAIRCMAMQGLNKEALDLFLEMKKQRLRPDGVTYVEVLTACSHGGLVQEGFFHFRSMMEDYCISPQLVHYGCMVDLLGRAGLLKDALQLIVDMPMEPNDVIWGSLLAGCRVHNNVQVAELVAERLLELPPERVGVYILLSNIYASAGMWSKVARVRLQLKEREVKKMPGLSMIEINGTMHEFTAGCVVHEQADAIEHMLDEMLCKLRRVGYLPDLSNVLLDVGEEEEKEKLLRGHSEKFAMAFGLISTRHGTSIRVVKNLRMCGDCHTFTKLLSELYDREIIIRDNRRFHIFRKGQCSCKDFW